MPFLMRAYKAGRMLGKEPLGQCLCPVGPGLRQDNFSPHITVTYVQEMTFLSSEQRAIGINEINQLPGTNWG